MIMTTTTYLHTKVMSLSNMDISAFSATQYLFARHKKGCLEE
jgi:hypothetical protein